MVTINFLKESGFQTAVSKANSSCIRNDRINQLRIYN